MPVPSSSNPDSQSTPADAARAADGVIVGRKGALRTGRFGLRMHDNSASAAHPISRGAASPPVQLCKGTLPEEEDILFGE